ncbi:Pentatricopeptide repeat-containing protein [Drosera capensis]
MATIVNVRHPFTSSFPSPFPPLHFPSLPFQNPPLSFPPKPSISSPPLSKTLPNHYRRRSISSSTTQLTQTHFNSSQNKQNHLSNSSPNPHNRKNFKSLYYKCLELLRLSARCGDVELARAVHAMISKFEECIRLDNSLITGYLKLGLVFDAWTVLRNMSERDVVSYTAFVSEFAKSGKEFDAIELFFEMRESGIEPSGYCLVALLTACGHLMELGLGFQVHSLVVKLGALDDIYVANNLLALYVKCGCLDIALQLFEEMRVRDASSWNTVITGMVSEDMYERAFELFGMMQKAELLRANQVTLSSVLKACAGCFASQAGREVHSYAIKTGLESDLSVSNALIGFYAKCGGFKDVETLYWNVPVKDNFTWTSMITASMEFGMVDLAMEIFDRMPERYSAAYNAVLSGLCRNRLGSKALDFFCRMLVEVIELTDQTLTSAIAACSLISEESLSREMHGFAVKFGLGSNNRVEAALFDMLTKCGRMSDARKMLDRRPFKQISSNHWTSMICGYARFFQPEEALELFHRGQLEGDMVVDEVISTVALGVAGTLGFEEIGKQIHCQCTKSGYLRNVGVVNGIVSMYSKCFNMEDATKAFNTLPIRDTVSWNSVIKGHLLRQQGDEALALWSKMEMEHKVYGIEPTSDHYAALVSVLCHWVSLEEAEHAISEMPFQPEPFVWRALLNGCRANPDSEVAKRTMKQILGITPKDSFTYILAANIYSASGRWQCSEKIRAEMRSKGFQKHPARSWIVNENRIHSFYSRDRSHFQTEEIYSGVRILIMECLKVGYVPDTSFVLHDVEEYQKRDFLYYHSAKLAVTYALLTTRTGKPIRVSKSLEAYSIISPVSNTSYRFPIYAASRFEARTNAACWRALERLDDRWELLD